MLISKDTVETVRKTGRFPDLPKSVTIDDLGEQFSKCFPPEETEDVEEFTWAWELMEQLTCDAPLVALASVATALNHPLTRFQASCIAAGPLEDLIEKHGQTVIEQIETLARDSARFRFLLSGVWPQGEDTEGEVWQRVLRARSEGPQMDSDDTMPAIGT